MRISNIPAAIIALAAGCTLFIGCQTTEGPFAAPAKYQSITQDVRTHAVVRAKPITGPTQLSNSPFPRSKTRLAQTIASPNRDVKLKTFQETRSKSRVNKSEAVVARKIGKSPARLTSLNSKRGERVNLEITAAPTRLRSRFDDGPTLSRLDSFDSDPNIVQVSYVED